MSHGICTGTKSNGIQRFTAPLAIVFIAVKINQIEKFFKSKQVLCRSGPTCRSFRYTLPSHLSRRHAQKQDLSLDILSLHAHSTDRNTTLLRVKFYMFTKVLVVLFACYLFASIRVHAADQTIGNTLSTESYGFTEVQVFTPLKGTISGVLIMLKPKSSAEPSLALSRRFSEEGLLVIEVEPSRFQSGRTKTGRGCDEMSDCLVALSAYVQRQKHLKLNFLPTLISYGEAGEYAESSWHEAPQFAFNSVISVDYCPKNTALHSTGMQRHTKWVILESPAQNKKCSNLATDIGYSSGSSHFIGKFDIVISRLSSDPNVKPGGLVRWVIGHLGAIKKEETRIPASINHTNIDDLQTVVIDPGKSGHHDSFVILYSGDGGWAEFTDDLAAAISHKNLPVVGINSMRYFWKEKNPERGAKDLARLIKFYGAKWHAKTVYLVGFSFGAGTLPFFVRRLPPDLMKSVERVVLVAPYRKADFEFFISDWLFNDDRGLEIMPEIQKLGLAIKPVCIFPTNEKDVSLCTQNKDAPLTPIGLPGGHHFEGKTSLVVEALLGQSKESNKESTKVLPGVPESHSEKRVEK